MPAGVRIRGLTKSYGPVPAVRGLDLDAAPGQITGLLGRNGAGKTTTLECLLGLRRPDAGTIAVDGIDAGRPRRRQAARRRPTPGHRPAGQAHPPRGPAILRQLLSQRAQTRRPDRPVRPGRQGGRPVRVPLPRPAAAAGVGPGVRERPARARAGRADGRPGPARPPAAARADRRPASRRPHGADEHPRHRRGRAAVRPRGRHPRRPRRRRRRPGRPGRNRRRRPGRRRPHRRPAAGPGPPSRTPDGYRLPAPDVAATVAAVAARCVRHGVELLDVAVLRPSLEDVFLRLTGPAT